MWTELRNRQPLLAWTAAAHLGVFLLCLWLSQVDGTELLGINRWIKPQKFGISIALVLGTLAWLWPVITAPATAQGRRRAAWILAVTLISEMVAITGQAARGVRSHFNTDSFLDAAVFQLMGLMILVHMGVYVVLIRWSLRVPASPYVWGVRLGLVLFLVSGLEGGVMAIRMAHAVGVADGGPGLPFVNWSTEGGDLRAAHFVGMHALQGLPLIGYLTGRTGIVLTFAAAWAILAGWVLVRALGGVPLL